MSRRFLSVILVLGLAASSVARGEDANPVDSVVWTKLRTTLFGSAPIEAAAARHFDEHLQPVRMVERYLRALREGSSEGAATQRRGHDGLIW